MSDPDLWQEPLERAFARYQDACDEGDQDRLARARLHLCQVLRDSGWHAPEVVVGQMLRDHALVESVTTGVHAPPVVPLQARRAVSPVPAELELDAFAR